MDVAQKMKRITNRAWGPKDSPMLGKWSIRQYPDTPLKFICINVPAVNMALQGVVFFYKCL